MTAPSPARGARDLGHAEAEACADSLKREADAAGVMLGSVDWVLVCGSGMGAHLLGPREGGGLGLDVYFRVPLHRLGLPAPRVPGHGDELIFGELRGEEGVRRVCVQSGRVHPYEGHPAALCTGALGAVLARHVSAAHAGLVLTCAVGGLDPRLEVGQLVSIHDHIGLFGPTSLRGPVFVGMSEAYEPGLRQAIADITSDRLGASLEEVVYMHARGPQYETPVEVECLRRLGGDVVGMSTTYEATLGAAWGVATCAIATVTNGAGQPGLTHQEVQVAAAGAGAKLSEILLDLLGDRPPRRREAWRRGAP